MRRRGRGHRGGGGGIRLAGVRRASQRGASPPPRSRGLDSASAARGGARRLRQGRRPLGAAERVAHRDDRWAAARGRLARRRRTAPLSVAERGARSSGLRDSVTRADVAIRVDSAPRLPPPHPPYPRGRPRRARCARRPVRDRLRSTDRGGDRREASSCRCPLRGVRRAPRPLEARRCRDLLGDRGRSAARHRGGRSRARFAGEGGALEAPRGETRPLRRTDDADRGARLDRVERGARSAVARRGALDGSARSGAVGGPRQVYLARIQLSLR